MRGSDTEGERCMRSRRRLVGVLVVAAAAGVVVASARRRRSSAATGDHLSARGRSDRNVALAKLAGQLGAAKAITRAQQVFASAARKEELTAELQLKSAEQVAAILGNMKGALMKLGQLASFLDDAMPQPVRDALAELQQNAPPMSPELAAGVVEAELGGPPEKVFAEWDPVPIASASIGQVHRAMTHDGRAVAVKVQYPGVDEAVRADLENLDLAGTGVGFLFPGLDARALVEELQVRLVEELDYTLEAANQRDFARWYEGHPFISVPGVVDDLSTTRVLTTDLAEGSRFTEMESWDQAERNLAAETIYRFVFRSLYRFGAFNGDPHPGNYLFRPGGQVTFLDFGLVKRLTPAEIALCYNIVSASVLSDDSAEIRRACEAAGLIAPGAPVSDDRVAEFMGIFWEVTKPDEVTTITADWASRVARRFVDGRSSFGDVMAHAGMPPTFVVLQRINLGLLAILGRLDATANWRRMALELWPTDGPPSTDQGTVEQAWFAARHGVGNRIGSER